MLIPYTETSNFRRNSLVLIRAPKILRFKVVGFQSESSERDNRLRGHVQFFSAVRMCFTAHVHVLLHAPK